MIGEGGGLLAGLTEEGEGAVGEIFLDGDALEVAAVVGGDSDGLGVHIVVVAAHAHHELAVGVVHVDVHAELAASCADAGDGRRRVGVAHFHLDHVSRLVHEQRRRGYRLYWLGSKQVGNETTSKSEFKLAD